MRVISTPTIESNNRPPSRRVPTSAVAGGRIAIGVATTGTTDATWGSL